MGDGDGGFSSLVAGKRFSFVGERDKPKSRSLRPPLPTLLQEVPELTGLGDQQRPPAHFVSLHRAALRRPQGVTVEPVALPCQIRQLVVPQDAQEAVCGVWNPSPACLPIFDGALADPEFIGHGGHRQQAAEAGFAEAIGSDQTPAGLLSMLPGPCAGLRIMCIMS
jgi:hypothetical protein